MHHGSQSHVLSLHRVLHITHTYICVYIYRYTYVRVCALDTQGRYIHISIYGSAPFIRRDDIWVWALYTQGRYMGLRPLYAGMIYGSGPFIPRDDTWVCALYTQG